MMPDQPQLAGYRQARSGSQTYSGEINLPPLAAAMSLSMVMGNVLLARRVGQTLGKGCAQLQRTCSWFR